MKGIEEKQIEAPYELPEGWKWCRLGDFINIFRGVSYKKNDAHNEKQENDCLIIRGGNIDEGCINLNSDNMFVNKSLVSENQIIKKNDVIIVTSTGSIKVIGRAGVSASDYEDVAFGAFLTLARPNEKANKSFVNQYFQSSLYRERIRQLASGVNINNIRIEYITESPFPLPPTLDEQQRIVNRIESMFAKLDEAKEKAQNVVDSFETRKAAILHKAFTGELTAKWRKENNPEESSKYLEKIKDKVEIRLDFKYWENTKLPESWCESTIGNLLYFAGRVGWKGLKAEEYTSEGPILLSVYNLNDGDEVSFNKINHITNERYDESPEIMVRKNDILLTKDGAGIGKLGYVNELPEKATINSSLLLIRPGDVANYKFIFYLLSGPALQNIVKERITGSATPHLFQRDIKEFVLPVPSLPEQQEIVRILDTVLEKESRAKEAAQTVLDQIALLKKSILARAFRGEL